MKKAYLDLPQGQLHYRIDGSGPQTILLVHQTPASSSEYLELMPLLAQKFQVIALDTPGYGMSDFPQEEPTVEFYARTNRDFLAALGIKQAAIVGHHTGASIVAEMAAAYPELVSHLIMSGCPVYSDDVRAERLKVTHAAEITDDGSHVTNLMTVINKYNPVATKEFRHQFLVSGLMPGVRSEDGHIAVYKYDIAARLPLVKCPTLLFSATTDIFFGQLESTSKLIPNCTTASIEGGDALILLEKPKEIADLVTKFIAG